MFKIYKKLNERLVQFYEVMLHCKQNLKDRALLSNMTNRNPIVYNKTRLSGKCAPMEYYLRGYKHLTKVFTHKISAINFDTSRLLRLKEKKDVKMMLQIQKTTVKG